MNVFFEGNLNDWQDLGGGIKRKVIGYTDSLMVVEVCFDKGAVGEVHYHEEHDQIAYVISGSVEVKVEEETRILSKGDAFIARKLSSHGVVSMEDNTILLDVFSPMRKDFIN
ncbi:cupin domain-containing protein [Vibrio nigripulchritudo]|uniref:cupin domain-containing protein n=1 Tax=Vibrio nigripulchritudo TaxID=28173 RepID=UPI0003B1DCF3|nr:cupin domain-containing protein [Vibrio nigripulchritudo]CCN73637.1 Pectin degradation protein kdgF [Vibrio nigripulchritudo SFn118]